MKSDQIVKHLISIGKRYDDAEHQAFLASAGFGKLSVSKMKEILTSAQAAIERYSPPDSPYLDQASDVHEAADDHRLECLMGIINALRHDYEAGALAPILELIRAEVFDDFLEMGEHLLEQGYKDPAAVVIGSVLEQHLRKLCDRVGISTLKSDGDPKKAELLNSELGTHKDGYGKQDQKSVTAWLGLRNDAAHGHYDKYQAEQVRLLLLGVRDFINRTRS